MLLLLALMHGAIAAADATKIHTIDELSQSKYWLRLLHYKPAFPTGKMRSLVDGPEFFFSPQGKTDAKAEMQATIAAFSKNIAVGKFKQHPQCAFPERYRFLKHELGLSIADVPCPKLDEYLAKFNARSATLVFSSAFPNNPGSMFGHTFLRINANVDPRSKLDILDTGLSFAAVVPPDDGGLTFALLGLTGGYIGQFGMIPYYAKVNEYSNSESRDLWEYDLNLTPDETARMLKHVWEIETNSWFDYYFFDENCSYILLAMLEVAKPEWDLTDFAVYVIPGETVKRVTAIPGAVTGVKFRPSLYKRLYQRLDALSGDQRHALFRMIDGAERPADSNDRAVLESLASYLYYVKQRESGKLADRETELLRQTLTRRAGLGPYPAGAAPSLAPIREDSRPDIGHHSYRLGTSSGTQKGAFFQELSFKFAFHDLLNDDTGYTRFSQIDFPGFTLRYLPSASRLNLEQIQALAITSLFPMTFIEKRPSWKVNVDYTSPKDFGCLNCHVGRGEAGVGAAVEAFSPDHLFYVFGVLDFEAGDALRKGYRWGPRAEAAVLLNPHPRFKLQLGTALASDLMQDDRPTFYPRYEWNQSLSLSQSLEIRSAVAVLRGYHEAKLTLNFYL